MHLRLVIIVLISKPANDGPSDMSSGDLSCLNEGDMMCNLECGDQTCDGSSEYCLEFPPGIDLGGFDLGGASGSFFECTPLPQECGANPDCECLGEPDDITECRREAEGFHVVGLSA